jgi:serpin B
MRAAAVFIGLAVMASACGGAQPTPTPASSSPIGSPTPSSAPTATPLPTASPEAVELARADVARAPASDAAAHAAATAINAFAFDLHRALAATGGNVVFSPTSIAVALAMARAGARGETAAQMDTVLRDVASDDHGDWLNSLDQALAGRSGTFQDDAGTEHELVLDIANAAFAQRDFALETAYLEALASRFGVGVYLVDYMADPDAARRQINEWARERTQDRIPEVLLPPDITVDTRLALVNAIYLKAPWERVFQEDQTTTEPFTRPDGTRVDVALMHSPGSAACATGAGWGAYELPYLGNSLSMLVVVPDDLAAFEATLDAGVLTTIGLAFETQIAVPDVALPRFEVETRANLATVLAALGMPAAFEPSAADFSGMTRADLLYIGRVIHQANISVDEKGTEAAAVTVVGMDTGGGPSDVCTVRANRPFLFAVRDRETGAILFLGRVTDPTAH